MIGTYQQFNDLTDAQNYANAQTALVALPPGGITVVWSTPILLADGTYVVRSYSDDTAIAWQSTWEIPQPPPGE
jgi:hypothetical protein